MTPARPARRHAAAHRAGGAGRPGPADRGAPPSRHRRDHRVALRGGAAGGAARHAAGDLRRGGPVLGAAGAARRARHRHRLGAERDRQRGRDHLLRRDDRAADRARRARLRRGVPAGRGAGVAPARLPHRDRGDRARDAGAGPARLARARRPGHPDPHRLREPRQRGGRLPQAHSAGADGRPGRGRDPGARTRAHGRAGGAGRHGAGGAVGRRGGHAAAPEACPSPAIPTLVRAAVPAAGLRGLGQALPGATHGLGTLTSQFGGYRPVTGTPPSRPRTDGNPLDRKEYLLHTFHDR